MNLGIGLGAILLVVIGSLIALRLSSAAKRPGARAAAASSSESQRTAAQRRQASHAKPVEKASHVAVPSAESPLEPRRLGEPPAAPTGLAEPAVAHENSIAAAPPAQNHAPVQEDEPAATPIRHVQPNDAELSQMIALASVPPKPRLGPKDLWSGTMPTALKELRDAIASGARGSGHSVAALRRYNTENLDDARGHLLLAGFYLNRGWSLDALDQYNLAYQIDPSSRGSPEMLSNMVAMVLREEAGADAARSIERTYQKEAIPSIVQTLHRSDIDAAAVARLKHLQARLARPLGQGAKQR